MKTKQPKPIRMKKSKPFGRAYDRDVVRRQLRGEDPYSDKRKF